MRDYDELVKALRCCAGNDTTCDDCPRASEKCIDSIQGLLTDAADAIEELLARIQKLEYAIRLLHIEKETFKTFSGL